MLHLQPSWNKQNEDKRQYLRSNKVGSIAGGHEKAIFSSKLLGKTKITDPD